MAGFPGFSTPAYGTVSGGLPWGGGGSGAGAMGATTPQGVAAGYQQAYNSALAMNQSNYNNILSGYQQSLAQQSTAQQAIQAGYSDLYNNVIGQVQNMYAGQSDTINRGSAQLGARSSQQLIDRGLGNTTIQSSVNRGVESDRQYQQSLLTGQEAGTMAQYMSQLGMAGLGNQQQGLNNATGQLNRQLDFMNSVNAKYPDAGLYGNLAQQAGMNQANRQNPLGAYGGGAFGGAATPKVGYTPAGGQFNASGGGDPGAGMGVGGGGSWMMDQYATPSNYGSGGGAGGGMGMGMVGGGMGGMAQAGGYGLSAVAGGMYPPSEAVGPGNWGDYGGGGDF